MILAIYFMVAKKDVINANLGIQTIVLNAILVIIRKIFMEKTLNQKHSIASIKIHVGE
jgi:hypothetical protein